MDKLNEQPELVKLSKKLEEHEESTFRGMSVKELEFELLKFAKHREEITSTKNADEELNSVKEQMKELSAPYREQLGGVRLKSRFVALLLNEKKAEGK